MVCRPRQATDIYPTARVTVDLGKADFILLAPAINSKGLGRVGGALCGLGNTGLNLDRTAQHIPAIQFSHGTFGMFLILQVDEAVGGVAAGERVNGNIDALAKVRGFSRIHGHGSSAGIHRELSRNEQGFHILRLGRVGHVAYI